MYKIAFMASALVLAGCGGQVDQPLYKLADSQWVLTGFESKLGVKQAPVRYLTLEFSGTNKIGGQVGCFAIKGDYSQTDAALGIKSAEVVKETNCVSAQEDTDFVAGLNSAVSFKQSAQTLALDLPDGRKLNFIKKFPGCTNPLPTQHEPTERLVISTRNIPLNDLIAQYEATRPDFRIVTAGDSCSTSVTVSVNPNTLMELRCDSRVAELIFTPGINF